MKPEEFRIYHEEKFKKAVSQFQIFKNYKNKDSLLSLLDYWLFSTSAIYFSYGPMALKKFSSSSINNPPRWSFLYEFDVESEIKNHLISSSFLSKGLSFLPKVYLPGGPIISIFDKILSRLSKFLVLLIPVKFEQSQAKILEELVTSYFNDLEVVVTDELLQKIPQVFKSEQLTLFNDSALKVFCSPHTFMDFIGYENIFLLNTRIEVKGFQHGGGYGLFTTDYYSFYEKELSHNFYGWGFLEENVKQFKYHKITSKNEEKRVIWLERPYFPKILKYLNEGQYVQYSSSKVISSIHRSLGDLSDDYFNMTYPGTYKSGDYIGYRGKSIKKANAYAEDLIKLNDIVVLDCSAASIIHFLIHNSIVFLLVIDNQSEPFFTENHSKWLAVLRENNLCFFEEEIESIQKSINNLLSDRYELPKEVKEIHSTFFN